MTKQTLHWDSFTISQNDSSILILPLEVLNTPKEGNYMTWNHSGTVPVDHITLMPVPKTALQYRVVFISLVHI
jgi:hypothetical protein